MWVCTSRRMTFATNRWMNSFWYCWYARFLYMPCIHMSFAYTHRWASPKINWVKPVNVCKEVQNSFGEHLRHGQSKTCDYSTNCDAINLQQCNVHMQAITGTEIDDDDDVIRANLRFGNRGFFFKFIAHVHHMTWSFSIIKFGWFENWISIWCKTCFVYFSNLNVMFAIFASGHSFIIVRYRMPIDDGAVNR